MFLICTVTFLCTLNYTLEEDLLFKTGYYSGIYCLILAILCVLFFRKYRTAKRKAITAFNEL